jgi:hypothetical protein
VTEVLVSGSTWSAAFLSRLLTDGLGDGGATIETGSSDQFKPVPYPTVNRLLVRFDKDVNITNGEVTLTGVNGGTYATTLTYDNSTFTATIALSADVNVDELTLELDDAITDLVGNALDGEWTNAVSTVSGDGHRGGDFSFRLNVLPGDLTGDGTVGADDLQIVLAGFTGSVTIGDPSQGDVHGSGASVTPRTPDGVVGADDLQVVLTRFTRTVALSSRAQGASADALGEAAPFLSQDSSQDRLESWRGWRRPVNSDADAEDFLTRLINQS